MPLWILAPIPCQIRLPALKLLIAIALHWNNHIYTSALRPSDVLCDLIWVLTVCKAFTSLPTGKFCTLFFVICWYFSKPLFSKNYFRNTTSVKHFGSRSGPTCCRSWYGSKLFAKIISRWQKAPRTENTSSQRLENFMPEIRVGHKDINSKISFLDFLFHFSSYFQLFKVIWKCSINKDINIWQHDLNINNSL